MTSVDFVLAQQRLIARRRAREAEALASKRESSRAAKQLARLPGPFGHLGEAGITAWNNISSREGTRPAFRVGQVDAELLDEELLELLKGQVGEAFKYFGTHIQDDWSAEIILSLRVILFKLTVWDHGIPIPSTRNSRFTDPLLRCNIWGSFAKSQVYGREEERSSPSISFKVAKSIIRSA
jgi:peroxin-2